MQRWVWYRLVGAEVGLVQVGWCRGGSGTGWLIHRWVWDRLIGTRVGLGLVGT